MRKSLTALLFALAVTAPALGAEPPSCLTEIGRAELRYKLPPGLLLAVGLAESGRRDAQSGLAAPWPWTLNALGDGHFYDNADEAAKETSLLLARDISVVDVGCMQVDLYHHPHAFQTIRAALDPETNVDYAARLLVDLKAKHHSWTAAVAAYHAGNPALGGDYLAKVLHFWKGQHLTVAQAGPAHGYLIDDTPQPLDVAAGFFEKRDYDAASAIYRAILKAKPDEPTALLGMAESLRRQGHEDDARLYLERLLTVQPRNEAGLNALLSLIDGGAADKRKARLLAARQIVPNAPQLAARLALVESEDGRPAEAAAAMGEAALLSPDDPVILLNHALMLDRAGNVQAAVNAYEAFFRAYRPSDPATLTLPIDEVRRRFGYLLGKPR